MGKEPARFRFPPPPLPSSDALAMPLLMIGPGTGVAVFLDFCQHLLNAKLRDEANFPNVPRYLFFGCRNLDKDGLCLDELKYYVREGILKELILCESEGNGELPKYVCDFLSTEVNGVPSRVFVCGDAKGMSKDVLQCFTNLVKEEMGKTDMEAITFMTDLHKDDRFVEDVWS
ncbi:unnamed protein product [Nippostrongylus brasiliensis]|uniref:Putative methionine synthase reductase (inferred by orthology to a C. elegans protein) n=1 Tax=Nippostrongylus brasiliensis TaxID=27835 RepID=A0A0N4Y8I7_NIPBR|nr:unnamed protein product [Nippostrongylus brasiliensis]